MKQWAAWDALEISFHFKSDSYIAEKAKAEPKS